MKLVIYLLLVFVMCLGMLGGCTGKETPAGEASTDVLPGETSTDMLPGEDILAERRQTVLAYMRGELSFYWTCDAPMPYYRGRTGLLEYTYQPGYIYRGIPYTGSGGTKASFLRYSQSVDERGVHSLSGFAVNEETGEISTLQLGSDCSTSVFNAWNQVANSIRGDKRSTKYMTENNGFLRVGSYDSDPDENADTIKTCRENGEETMYAAYAQLQPGDAAVHNNNGSGHAIMITEVAVMRNQKTGVIMGNTSYVKIMDQTDGNLVKDVTEFDEAIGTEVHPVGNLEKVYTFAQLYEKGYLPITCRELIDPAPVTESLEMITGEQGDESLAGVLRAWTLESSRAINLITLTATDGEGREVFRCSHVPKGANANTFPLSLFLTEPSHLFRGVLAAEDLPAGAYALTCTVLTVTGKTQTWEVQFTAE